MPERAAAGLPEPLLLLDLTAPTTHLVQASLQFTPPQQRLVLRLPAWTPGSYLIRDYVSRLEGLEVLQNGRRVPLERLEVAAWVAELPDRAPVEARWRILATEPSVRTCELGGDHGFLALAGVALLVEGLRWHPHRLELRLPSGWQPFLSLPPAEEGGWRAADYDALIDTPVEAGPHACHTFSVAGVPHRWVTRGGDLPARDPAWLADVERVCLACCRLMGVGAPASPAYLFIQQLPEQGYGGQEHDPASVLVYGRTALARPEGRRKLLQLVAHEYLHQWNVRRLRPAPLSPIDYDRPTIVPTLWFAEGITSYFDTLLPFAAGLGTEAELLEDLGADLSRYRLTPGRRVQSLRVSSQEAWVKLYRADAHAADNQVSYYLKGAVVALVLDLHLRRHGSWLGAVLQRLWHSHGRWRRGYGEDDLRQAFREAAADLDGLLEEWLTGTEDPDLDAYLADVGLRLEPDVSRQADAGWQLEAMPAGLQLRRVRRDGPAQRAGLQVGDELLALDGRRLRRDDDVHLAPGPTGGSPDALEVLFCRDGRVRQCRLQPAAPQVERWRLVADPQAPATALKRRLHWGRLEP
ncbi:MAG: M61 family metallopeptidase [Cyanobacteriota bacterium]